MSGPVFAGYVSVYSGPGAALGRGQAAALGRDRAALDAVRRGHLHPALHGLVDLRRAHVLPEPSQLRRHVRLDADVVRRVVPGLVAAQEDRRELVEGQLPVRRRIATRRRPPRSASWSSSALEARAPRRERPSRGGHRPGQRAAEHQARARTPAACSAPAAGRPRRSSPAATRRSGPAHPAARASRPAAAPRRPPRPRAGPTRPRSGSPSAPARSRARRRRRRSAGPARAGAAAARGTRPPGSSSRPRRRARRPPAARAGAGASSAPAADRAPTARRRGSRARPPSRA